MFSGNSFATQKQDGSQDVKKRHISEEPWTIWNWYQHIYWPYFTFLVIIPLFGLVAAINTPLRIETLIWSTIYYFITGLCITAGTRHILHIKHKVNVRLQDTTAYGRIGPTRLRSL